MISLPLQEHAPVPKDKSSEDDQVYSPTEEERKLLQKCNALFDKAKTFRGKYDYCWPDYYKLYRGRQWKEQRPSYRAQEVFNLIWQTIQSQVPIITDSKPKFDYMPQEPNDREFAELMNDISTADWEKKNWLFTLTEVLYDSHILGTGLSVLKVDKDQEIQYKSEDPFYFFPAPSAEDLKTKCPYVVHAQPEDLAQVRKNFPQKGKYVKSDVSNFTSQERIDLSSNRFSDPSTDQLYVETSRGGFSDSKTPEVLLKCIYMEDDEIIEEEIKASDDATEIKYQQRKKFPDGRKVIIANDVILYDGPIPPDVECKFPYQRLVNYLLSRQFWGVSEIEALESPQRTFNKLVSYALDVLYLMGNPIWVVDSTSGVFTENLTNQPGLVVEKEPGSEVRREEGVQLQPYVLQLIDRLKDWFDHIAGSQDVTRGIPTGGVTAASAIADLQNAAQTRIRQKVRNLDAYLQDFGQQYASFVLQFYDSPKIFRLTNKDGSQRFFKMHIKKLEDGGYEAIKQDFTENGLLDPDIKTLQLRGKLDVRVSTSSSLPFSKVQNEKRAFELFDRQIIDAEQVLKDIDYPNWQAIIERMNAKAQQVALQQQQQQQQIPQAA